MKLIEKYRPTTYEQIIGQDKAVARLRRIVERPSFDGDAFWIVGPSGTGKTTLAWVLARQFAKNDLNIVELDGEACTVEAVRQAQESMKYPGWDGGFRVWLVNEAQAMTAKAVQAWLTTLDRLPRRVLVVFTTTDDRADLFGEYDGPFKSRTKQVSFTNQGLAPLFADAARRIAQGEGLDGQSEDAYKRLVQKCRNNFRAVLQAIESGDMLEQP